jgi:phytoene dehydrogenase-like protein
MKGILLGVEEKGGAFRTGAEVEHVRIGPDGRPHADLVFLDAPPPERWGVAEA